MSLNVKCLKQLNNKVIKLLKHIQFVRPVLVSSGLLFFYTALKAQTAYDSLKIKVPKHFFQTAILLDAYSKPKQTIKETDPTSKRLKDYAVKQYNLSFYTPIATINNYSHDSTINDNTHYLLTGNFMLLQPQFGGLQQHLLTKMGLGFRLIHNTGKKGLFFAEFSPFVTSDNTLKGANYWRMASTILYSHLFNDRFNLRVGITKSFLWGNRHYLPFFGVRIGKLDGVNLSFQFPRNINLQVPLSQSVRLNAHVKPQGGMFLFSNVDTLYFKNTDRKFHFTRYEVLAGLRIDVTATEHFAFYVAGGISGRNNITLYSEQANTKYKRLPLRKTFYELNTAPTGFINLGCVIRFGKRKSIGKNTNLYEAIDLNNGIDPGDNGLIIPNSEIRKANTERSNLKLKDVQDLIDYNDY